MCGYQILGSQERLGIHSILLHNFGTGNQYKFASRLKANRIATLFGSTDRTVLRCRFRIVVVADTAFDRDSYAAAVAPTE